MNISDIINDDEPKKESLHDKRWREMKKESSDRSFRMAREAAIASLPKKDNLHGDSKGKDLKFKPLVYYTAQDALQHCMKDFEDQASKNIDIIKATRETKGQKLTTKSDLKMVIGNFHEGKRMIKTGIFVPVYMYVFIKEWCGSICIFEIAESDYGTGKMKRRGYTVEKVSVVYYQSNGVGMGKEQILKQPITNFNHHPDKDNQKKSNESGNVTIKKLSNKDIEEYFDNIEKKYGITIPSQVKNLLKIYNDELIHCYGHDLNCVPLNLNTERCRLLFEEASEEFNKKYYDSGIKPSAYKDFVNIESMGNGDSLLVHKNNNLYFYSHDTNEPLT